MSGTRSYHAGKTAEDQVCNQYLATGHNVVARRWRGRAGELDLVMEKDGQVIVVEVKQSSSFARAMRALTARQIGRIYRSAGDMLRHFPRGQLTPVRFDLACVDGVGRIDILEIAIMP